MKAGFYAYMILTAIDYSLTKRAIISRSRYLFSHLFGASLLPMVMMVYFFAGPAIFIKIESIPLEILFANLALIATSTNVFLLENALEKLELSTGLKWMMTSWFILNATQFIIFNYRLPWFDVFATPPGW